MELNRLRILKTLLLFSLFSFTILLRNKGTPYSAWKSSRSLTPHQRSLIQKCLYARTPAGAPPSFNTASRVLHGSDRFEPGTPPTLIRNAKILTGHRNGSEAEALEGDILLNKGVIVGIGYIPNLDVLAENVGDLIVIDAQGRWITPGLVDIHSHLGVDSAPELDGTYLSFLAVPYSKQHFHIGAKDTNSHNAPILPWLRSIDGLNTHDDSYNLAIAGGVTTVQVLPGSGDNIGGQAVLIKLRSPPDRSVSSRVVEPPRGMFVNTSSSSEWVSWRHMKHACGENPNGWYAQSRMDAAWNFRNAYNEARKLRDAQNEFCERVERRDWDSVGERKFPDDLQWESLVDVLRGKVKVRSFHSGAHVLISR